MNTDFNKEILEQYLLGMLKDEELLVEIEELISHDKKFAERIEIIEDDLIDEYSRNQLSGEKLENFRKLFLTSKTRRSRIIHSKAMEKYAAAEYKDENVEERAKWFWSNFSPKLAFSLAIPLLLVGMLGIWFFGYKQNDSNSYIAQIDSLNENSRPLRSRIVEFRYLPHSSMRGNKDEDSSLERKRRLLETKLLQAVEDTKTSDSFNDLGVFYLSGKRFDEAITQFENALRISPDNSEARSNLGVALFEKSNREPLEDEKLKLRAEALDETTKAIKAGDQRAEPFFNRALILQAMNVPRQAIEAWKEYLEKDSKSKWTDEARKNLKELESKEFHSYKKKEQVLDDFIKAFEGKDDSEMWRIHSHTKEVNAQRFLPMQLARSYLSSNQIDEPDKAEKYLNALKHIGKMEKQKNADVFFYDLVEYYSNADIETLSTLGKAHNFLDEGLQNLSGSRHEECVTNLKVSRDLFGSVGNVWEKGMLEVPLGFCLTRTVKIKESNAVIKEAVDFAKSRNYKWLLSAALDWQTSNIAIENELSKSLVVGRESLKLAEETGNIYQIQRMSEFLSLLHLELGEIRGALRYLSKIGAIENKYSENHKQAWRNHKGYAELFGGMGLFETAVVFGNEYVHIAEKLESDRTLLKLSHYSLAKNYLRKNDFVKAKQQLAMGNEVKLNSFQKHAEERLFGESKFIEAEINRRTGNCDKATEGYRLASNVISKNSKFVYENFMARKGLLLCYAAENSQKLLETELEDVLNIYERNRINLNEERARNTYFHNEQTIYDIAIDLYLKKGDKHKAFQFSEDSKARSLLDFIQNGAEIKKGDLNYENVAKPFKLSEIQEKMPEDSQIIQYAVLPEKIVVWLITKVDVAVVTTPISSKELKDKVFEYIKVLKEKNNDITLINEKSNVLFKALIAPIFQKLDTTKSLFIVSDKFLHQLPFSSLFSLDSGKYLIEDLTITIAPSSTIFVLKSGSAEQKTEEEKLIAYGNPTFDRVKNPHLDNLDFAKKEALEISKLYKAKKVYADQNATKENFLTNFKDGEILHFAGHYVANSDQPLNSKLLMAKGLKNDDSDLRVLEIAKKHNQDLKLVVLSACQTDVETYYHGEGAIGAARIFLGIGSPIVVASHFEVDSERTAELMTKFHRYRKNEGLSVAKSLQKVQIEAIKSSDSVIKSPFYWSAFSVIGGHTNY